MQVELSGKTYEVTQDQIDQAKLWLQVNAWHDLFTLEEIDKIPYEVIVKAVHRFHSGGWQSFLDR